MFNLLVWDQMQKWNFCVSSKGGRALEGMRGEKHLSWSNQWRDKWNKSYRLNPGPPDSRRSIFSHFLRICRHLNQASHQSRSGRVRVTVSRSSERNIRSGQCRKIRSAVHPKDEDSDLRESIGEPTNQLRLVSSKYPWASGLHQQECPELRAKTVKA